MKQETKNHPEDLENHRRPESSVKEDEIDLVEVAKTIWANRKIIYRTVAIFFVLGLLIAFLSPVEYESQTVLLPEMQDQQMGGSAGRLLQQFGGLAGISLGDMNNGGTISPQLYPQILKSAPFLLHLMDQEVYFSKEDTTVTVFTYFNDIKSPSVFGVIAGYTIGLPGKIKKLFSGKDEATPFVHRQDGAIKMTKEQKGIAEALVDRIKAELDAETGTVKVISEMPDPEAAAAVARIANEYLTSFVTEYQTNKIKQDLEFIQDRHNDARERFENAQMALANFRDNNVMITTARARTEEERLQTEYNLAFNVYNGLAQQLEQAKIQVQEKTPVFNVLEPVKVPLEKSEPKRGLTIIISLFLGFVIGIAAVFIFMIYFKVKSRF